MKFGFQRAEWNEKPPEVEALKGGLVRVNRNLVEETRTSEDGSTYTMWVGETAVMTEPAYYAYEAASQVEAKREADVIDEYTMELIEGGVL